MTKKPKAVLVGRTPVAPFTRLQLKKLNKMIEKRVERDRERYAEVRGKVVDYIRHSIDDGTLYITVSFKDKTAFSLRYACGMFVVGADISDWKSGNDVMIREYMKPVPR